MSLTRRTILASAPAAAAAATLGGPAMAQAQTPATGPMASGTRQAPGFYRYKVGDIEVTAVFDGFAARPLQNFVRDVPLEEVQKAASDAFLPTDAFQNPYTPLVLNVGGQL